MDTVACICPSCGMEDDNEVVDELDAALVVECSWCAHQFAVINLD